MPVRAWASACWKRLQSIGQLTRSCPHIIIIPLLMLGLMVGLGIWAVGRGAEAEADAASGPSDVLPERAVRAVIQLKNWVKQTRNMSTIVANWATVLPDFMQNAPPSLGRMQLLPSGWSNLTWPMPTREQLLTDFTYREMNLINSGPGVLKSMDSEDTLVLGPFIPHNSVTVFAIQVPVFLTNVNLTDTFGLRRPSVLPPSRWYNNVTRTWGTVYAVLFVEDFLVDDSLQTLRDAGYQVEVWINPNPILKEGQWQNLDLNVNATEPYAGESVSVDLAIGNRVLRLYVWQDSWETSWRGPVIVAVVVLSVLCSLLIFSVLLSWTEHRLLLSSILPEATIQRMRQEMNWHKSVTGPQDLRGIEIETPAKHMMTIIQAVQAGETPPMSIVVAVQQALERSADVYTPANQDLKSKLKQATDLDDEVQQALVQQLAGFQPTKSESSCGILPGQDSPELLDVISQHADECTGEAEDRVTAIRTSARRTPRTGTKPNPLGAGVRHTGGSHSSANNRLTGDSNENKTFQEVADASTVKLLGVLAPVGQGDEELGGLTGKIPAHIFDPLERALASANTWAFDAYALEEASNGRPLSALSFWLLERTDCLAYIGADATMVVAYLQKIESGYKSNPYHNARHAADVLQSFHAIIHQGGLAPGYVDQLTMLGCYLAATIHDYEHMGRSNDFLVNTTDTLAVRYNDKSPMENHHLAAAFELLLQPEYNFLKGLSKQQWDKLRKLVIDLVLATDMRQHFAIIGQFTSQYNTKVAANVGASPSSTPRHSIDYSDKLCCRNVNLVATNDADRLLTLQAALKCSDLGHLAAPLPIHLKWVSGLEDEFFQQGDAERARGLPISPLCDRNKEGVTKSQVGFFEFVVLPLFSNFCARYTGCQPMLDAVVSNYQYWKSKAPPKPNKE